MLTVPDAAREEVQSGMVFRPPHPIYMGGEKVLRIPFYRSCQRADMDPFRPEEHLGDGVRHKADHDRASPRDVRRHAFLEPSSLAGRSSARLWECYATGRLAPHSWQNLASGINATP